LNLLKNEQEENKCFGDIEFDNITFAYESRPDRRILKNFSLKIEQGKSPIFII